MTPSYFEIIIAFFGGLGLFLFGMHSMASGLQKTAGTKMKKLLEVLTKNKFMALLVGVLVTAVIQSSSATTVMVVGFVNAGIMTLSQSVGVIIGANIGTTVTSWLVSSIEWAKYLSPLTFAPAFIFAGAAMLMFSKRERIKHVGEIIAGFGILFVGMSMMSDAVSPLQSSPTISNLFLTLGANPFLGVLAGALVTAIVQSSSASVSILQTLAFAGLIPWNAAIYIIMGQNIGTCITAMLSSLGASKNARSAANVHLLFNVIGSVVFSILAVIYFTFMNPSFGNSLISITQVSIAHTAFNLASTALLFPFSDQLVYLAQKITGLSKSDEDELDLIHLDDRVLETPSFAIENCLKEIERLGRMALQNLKLSNEALLEADEDKIEKVIKREKNIDMLQEAINQYMVKLCNRNITESQNKMMTSLFHTVIDIERIGDHSENIAELAQFRVESELVFSQKALDELKSIMELTQLCVENSIISLAENNMDTVKDVFQQEEEIDILETQLRVSHITRLTNGDCHPASGVVFLDAITNLERVSDHALNIAEVVMAAQALNL